MHTGNAANALLVQWLARQAGGTVMLRIDDMDTARCRDAYLDDIIDLLSWLGIEWDAGPRTTAEFDRSWSTRHPTSRYRQELEAARERGLEAYACSCSRRDLAGPAQGGCPGGCRTAGLPLEAHRTSLRARIPPGTTVVVGNVTVDLATEHGDVVLWRRDDLPAYHLASIIEDRDAGITDVVRGADLLPSTALQVWLAPWFAAESVAVATYRHHPLLTAADGSKLSKSQLGIGPLPRTEHTRGQIEATARTWARIVGITPG